MRPRKIFSVQETQEIIEKLKSGVTINSLKTQKRCGVNILKRIIKDNKIPYVSSQSHKGRITEEYAKAFTKNSTKGNFDLVKKIKQHGLISHDKCHCCGLDSWLNGKLTLELDHINGDNTDNRIENLRFLCPNCHSQTPNYRGKNILNGRKKVSDEDLIAALKKESNVRKALMSVGLTAKGANYNRAYKLLSVS